MTTENDGMVELPDRSVSVLLSLDTYQGMTDTEIQSLIDWHVQCAKTEALQSAELEAHQAAIDAVISDSIRSNTAIENMLQSVVKRCTNLELGVVE